MMLVAGEAIRGEHHRFPSVASDCLHNQRNGGDFTGTIPKWIRMPLFASELLQKRPKAALFLHFPNLYSIVIFKVVLKFCNEGCFYEES